MRSPARATSSSSSSSAYAWPLLSVIALLSCCGKAAGECLDNPQDYIVDVDVQIEYPDGEIACDANQDSGINTAISDALNQAFPTTVNDWDGDALFGTFTPDDQGGTCPSRDSIDCSADSCRWGCVVASTTDCGTSSLTNWANLAEDVLDKLATLGYACLGIADQLQVVLRVDDPSGTGIELTSIGSSGGAGDNGDKGGSEGDSNVDEDFNAMAPPVPSEWECQDNPQDYNLNVNVQIEYLDVSVTCDANQDSGINTAISDALNEAFPMTVGDWDGNALFGTFALDSCPSRPIVSDECTADFCRWGCVAATTTNCGTSSLTNWANLADDIRDKLATLGYECLGIADQLQVMVLVDDPDGTGTPISMAAKTIAEEEDTQDAKVKAVDLGTNTSVARPGSTAGGATTTNQKDKAKAAGRFIDLEEEEETTANDMEEQEATVKTYGPSKPLHVRSKLVFTFFEGRGREPSEGEIKALETASIPFFSERLGTDAKFASVFQEFQMQKLVPKYDEAVPDEFTLEFMTTVLVDESAQVTAHQAADAIASSNFKKYINDYVRKLAPSESNDFFDTFRVFFKGVVPKDNTPTDQRRFLRAVSL